MDDTDRTPDPLGVVLATGNPHKVKEIRKILGRLPMPLKGLGDFPPSPPVIESGQTLEANALIKARSAVRRTGQIGLSDDTGLEVPVLKGAPGVRSARYAGDRATFEDNNKKLLAQMKKASGAKRAATFRCVVALVFPWGPEKVFEGHIDGVILNEARGRRGFGYDPLFQPKGSSKSFAEMTTLQKNRLSHRARAFRKAKNYLRKYYRENPGHFRSFALSGFHTNGH